MPLDLAEGWVEGLWVRWLGGWLCGCVGVWVVEMGGCMAEMGGWVAEMGGWVLWARWMGGVGFCFKTINLRLIDNINTICRHTMPYS